MKIIFILTFIFVFSSCSFTSYRFNDQKPRTGVDFTAGKWLLNDIDAPTNIQEKLIEKSTKDFETILGNRFQYRTLSSGLILPPKMIFPLEKTTLKKIKMGSGYDYFISVKAEQIRNDFGSIDLSRAQFNKNIQSQNINQVSIEIYDLNRETIIYSQRVVATVGKPTDNRDVNFSQSSHTMLIKAYQKLMKDLKSKSVLVRI